MSSEWDCLLLAAKATDREKAFREHWPAVEAQLRQWGYPSWGIAQAHLVLSSGGSVNEAVEALRSDEEVTEAGRARVQWLRRLAHQQGLALRRHPHPPFQRGIGPGGWMIVDRRSNSVVAGTERTGSPNMSLDEVEAWLTRQDS
jgi:hypothetical protein